MPPLLTSLRAQRPSQGELPCSRRAARITLTRRGPRHTSPPSTSRSNRTNATSPTAASRSATGRRCRATAKAFTSCRASLLSRVYYAADSRRARTSCGAALLNSMLISHSSPRHAQRTAIVSVEPRASINTISLHWPLLAIAHRSEHEHGAARRERWCRRSASDARSGCAQPKFTASPWVTRRA